MPLFNLLGAQERVVRDVSSRLRNKEINRQAALKFGREYFDGSREQGYGGYVYDGRWRPVAARVIDRYGLKSGSRVLDVGCAKGFLMKDLLDALPGLEVWGLDVSDYAIRHAHPDVAHRMLRASCDRLPWHDGAFDAVLAINTIHNLDRAGCMAALREIVRVGRPGRAFVQVDAYRNESERDLFEAWMLTAKTYCRPEEWRALFDETGYDGDYFWTILETDPAWVRT